MNIFRILKDSSFSLKLYKKFVRSNVHSHNYCIVAGREYPKDDFTNITPRILSKMGVMHHTNQHHPLGILSSRIIEFFYKNYRKMYRVGTPLYSVYDNFSPVVSTKQNFDELLIPDDHVSRRTSDSYYVNRNTVLRAHTSAHEADLIRSGLDAFLVVGDVYRRDEIDRTHYPVFHQFEGVRLFTKHELFARLEGIEQDPETNSFLQPSQSLRLSPESRPSHRQERHSELSGHLLELELKSALEDLVRNILGPDTKFRWVPAFFPWTHPSFELEIETEQGEWMEMLGCGVVEQDMLDKCGAGDKVGIAFGLGLERWAMRLFDIPDIRLFWSTDEGFLSQFRVKDIHQSIKYKSVSVFPPCLFDISFWLPTEDPVTASPWHPHDFYEIAATVAGDWLERVEPIDEYTDQRTGRRSMAFRLHYRHMHRSLSKDEVGPLHAQIVTAVETSLGCTVR